MTNAVWLALAIFSQPAPPQDQAKKSLSQAQELLKDTEKAEVVFYQVDPASEGGKDGKRLRGWKILLEKPLKDPKAVEEVRSTLLDPKTYAEFGAKCFEPGLGFGFKAEAKAFELVICLKCNWIYVYQGGDSLKHSWALSKAGVDRLMKFYLSQVGEPKK